MKLEFSIIIITNFLEQQKAVITIVYSRHSFIPSTMEIVVPVEFFMANLIVELVGISFMIVVRCT